NLQINFSSVGLANDAPGDKKKAAQLQPGSAELEEIASKSEVAEESGGSTLARAGGHLPNRSLDKEQVANVGSQTLISDVTIEEDGQQLKFTLQTTSKPSFKHFQLDGPSRLVIDVDSSSFKIARRAVEVHSDLIQRI